MMFTVLDYFNNSDRYCHVSIGALEDTGRMSVPTDFDWSAAGRVGSDWGRELNSRLARRKGPWIGFDARNVTIAPNLPGDSLGLRNSSSLCGIILIATKWTIRYCHLKDRLPRQNEPYHG
jgi:hypothetical protein